jgi:hypothetical protein
MLSATIERAVRQAMAAGLRQDGLVSEITAAVQKLQAESAVVTTTTERTRAESARLLALWEDAGADRNAAGKVAAKMSKCPHEREIVAQRIRTLVRKHKRNA